jgi:ribosomal protein S18 acetylase RimI-like enzyme
MDIQIKPATFSDAWWAAGREFEYLPPVDPAFAPENMQGARRLLLRALVLPQGYRRSLLKNTAWAGEKRIGFLFARANGDSLHVETIGVEPAYRRQGVGSTLAASAVAFARERDLAFLTSVVTPQNLPGRFFLEALGLRPYREFHWVSEGFELKSPDLDWGIRELKPVETLPAYESWQTKVIRENEPQAADLLLSVYLRSAWRATARHWVCRDKDSEVGYLRIAGLRGKYQAHLICLPEYWQSEAQVSWLSEALSSYPISPQNITLGMALDDQVRDGKDVWEAARFQAGAA